MRSRLLSGNIVCNPFYPRNPINSSELNRMLLLGQALTDNTSLGKLRDCYPLQLFTIPNAIKLYNTHTKESFFFVFIFALWIEANNNADLDKESRLKLYDLLLRIFINLYDLYTSCQWNESVKEYNSKNALYVFYFVVKIN